MCNILLFIQNHYNVLSIRKLPLFVTHDSIISAVIFLFAVNIEYS